MKKLFFLFLFLFTITGTSFAQITPWYNFEASDCTALTGGKDVDLCLDTDDFTLWQCEPSVGDCDTAGEWKQVSITPTSTDTLTNKTINTASNTITIVEADISDLSHTTDTNANTVCTGTTTYLDGEGNCDDISSVYEPAGITESDISDLSHTVDTNLTEEEVEDFVGGMLGGTETGISVTYQDSTNDIDFVVTETDPTISTLTNTKWCSTDGSIITCTEDAPSGSGDITDVFDCASGNCASIALSDTDLLDMSAVSISSTTEGLILPQHATDCSSAGTAEGQVCWEADGNTLWVGDGTTVTQIGVGSAPATADISDVSVTQTELAELETLGATSISAGNWTGLSNLSGTNTGDDVTDYISEVELDTEAELESQLTDVTNVIVSTEIDTYAELNTLSTDTDAVLDTDIGSTVQAYDADLDDLADGSLTGSKVSSTSTTASGVVELATLAEMDIGTDTTRAMGVDEFNGSDWGARTVFIVLLDDTTATAVADGTGDIEWVAPTIFDGWNIVDVECGVLVAGTTNTTDIQIHNVTSAADILTTKCTIDSTETSSHTAATAPVISGTEDDLTTADRIRIDVDAISTTPANGLWVELTLRKP